ncbi:MAG: TrkA family potassium uptake protein [Firmicutes bacterium]|nr:TrkA family potassium uptake protein [Bacillota bacterium]
MYIIVAGGGIVGRTLIKRLSENHELIVVDRDEEVCNRIHTNYGVDTIVGNATRIPTLKKAGIDKCDIAIGVMGHDSDTIAFSLLAKDFDVDRILVRMRDPEYHDAYKLTGATNISSPTDMIVNKFLADIEEPDIRRIVSLGNGVAEIFIVTIPEGAKCTGDTILTIEQDNDFPENCTIAGIFNKEDSILKVRRNDQEINENDQVFLLTSEIDIKEAAEFLMKI